MDRRESIRSLFLGSMAGGLALESCVSAPAEEIKASIWKYQYGRTPEEATRDEKLLNSAFFEFSIKINPSAPIPKFLLHKF